MEQPEAGDTRRVATNTSRDRMKREIATLREAVGALQHQLLGLKKPTKLECSSNEARLASAWEALARAQCEQRYRAEVENAKLRSSLDEQLKVAHTVQRYLSKRHRCEASAWMHCTKRLRKRTEPTPLDALTMNDDITSYLDVMYARTNAVFVKPCFHSGRYTFRDIQLRHDGPRGSYVEACDARLVPFSIGVTADAVWRYFQSYPAKAWTAQSKNQDPGCDTIVRDLCSSLNSTQYHGEFRTKLAVRRYSEAERVIVVWIAFADPGEVLDPPLREGMVRYSGYMLIRPPRHEHAADLHQKASLYQSYLTADPQLQDGAADFNRKLGALTSFVLDTIGMQIDTGTQLIDDILLESAMRRADDP